MVTLHAPLPTVAGVATTDTESPVGPDCWSCRPQHETDSESSGAPDQVAETSTDPPAAIVYVADTLSGYVRLPSSGCVVVLAVAAAGVAATPAVVGGGAGEVVEVVDPATCSPVERVGTGDGADRADVPDTTASVPTVPAPAPVRVVGPDEPGSVGTAGRSTVPGAVDPEVVVPCRAG
jgi:hypothetical protein